MRSNGWQRSVPPAYPTKNSPKDLALRAIQGVPEAFNQTITKSVPTTTCHLTKSICYPVSETNLTKATSIGADNYIPQMENRGSWLRSGPGTEQGLGSHCVVECVISMNGGILEKQRLRQRELFNIIPHLYVFIGYMMFSNGPFPAVRNATLNIQQVQQNHHQINHYCNSKCYYVIIINPKGSSNQNIASYHLSVI